MTNDSAQDHLALPNVYMIYDLTIATKPKKYKNIKTKFLRPRRRSVYESPHLQGNDSRPWKSCATPIMTP